jgi:hypothetical protein
VAIDECVALVASGKAKTADQPLTVLDGPIQIAVVGGAFQVVGFGQDTPPYVATSSDGYGRRPAGYNPAGAIVGKWGN